MKHEKELIHPDELMKYYGQIVDPLRDHDRALLREKAILLKQVDGESWACGEAIWRIINLLSMCELFDSQSLRKRVKRRDNMVEVKSDKITRIEVIMAHAKEIQAFLAEYHKKYGHPIGWGEPLKLFIRKAENNLDHAILGAYKKAKKHD